MANDKQINLDFYARVKTDVDDIKGVVNNLKTQLDNLKLPANATKGFERAFKNLTEEIQNFETIASGSVAGLADTKKIENSWKKISSLFDNIDVQLKDLGAVADKIFPKEVTSNINKANKALEEYQNKLQEVRDTEKYKQKRGELSQAEDIKKVNQKKYKDSAEKLAGKETEVAAKKSSWLNIKDDYDQKAAKVAQLTSEYNKLKKTYDDLKTLQTELESKNIIGTSSKAVTSSHKEAIKNKKKEIEDLESEDKNSVLSEKKKRVSEAKQKFNTAKASLKNSKSAEKVAEWTQKVTETQEAYNKALAEYNDASNNYDQNLAARKAALQEELNLLEEQSKQAEMVSKANVAKTKKEMEAAGKVKQEAEADNEENEKTKREYDTAVADLKKLRIETESYKTTLEQSEQAVENFNQELKDMEVTQTKEEWDNLVKVVKEFTDVDLNTTQGDIEEITRILQKYSTDEIKKTPEILEKLRAAAKGVAPALEDIDKKTEEAADGFKEMDRAARDMENLKDQVLDFFSISNAIQIFKDAIRSAFDTVKELDAAMTETAVVTDFSIGDMWDKLPEYSDQATQLGTSIKSLYEATTLYYQQGLNSAQAMDVGVETMKMARIAGMDAAAATEAMTAALRGFNMEIDQTSAKRINDVYSELAAVTAADTEQIATAMSKTASIASSANMEFEATAALLAQIIETTQEAPETAGTAMKTIIARFTEVKKLYSEGMLTGEDSEGEVININKIDEALKTVGISLSDFLNGKKGIDEIFLELASKWDTLDLATQRYIATTAAGSRQQSRFLAMMGNYERTMELVTAANNSAGASQKQFDKTLESLDAKLQRLRNAWDTFTMGLANNELIKVGVDLLTKLLETINNLTDDLGGAAGGFAKLAIAIGGLKIGKNLFNSIFDVKPLTDKLGKATGVANVFAKTLNKLGVEAKHGLYQNVEKANASVRNLSNGMTIAGVACGALAQYLRSLGLEDVASNIEKIGTGLILLGSGINAVNSLAVAMGTTIGGLLKGIGAAISSAFSAVIAFLAPIWPLALAIAAAIGAVVALCIKLYKNSPTGKLKEAQKATEEAAKSAQEAADAYNNLSSALDNIFSKTNSLDGMTRGTQEWRNAVIELNKEMMSLIEQYPELAGYLTNEGGVLKLDYDKKIANQYGEMQTVEDVMKTYQQRAADAQQKEYLKRTEEKEAEINLERSKVKKQAGSWYTPDYDKAVKESKTGSMYDDQLAVLDELAQAIANGEVQNTEADVQRWLAEDASNTNFQISNWESFDYSAIQEYGNYLLSQQAAIEGLTDASIAAQMAMMDFTGISIESQDLTTSLNSDILRASYEKSKQENEKKESQVTEADRDAYAKSLGYTKDKNIFGQTVYKDKEGTKQRFTDEDVANYISTSKPGEHFETTITNLAKHLDSANEEQQALFSEVFSEGAKELSLETLAKFGEYKDGQFGLSSDGDKRDDLAVSMGFENFGKMAEAFNVETDKLAEQLNDIFNLGGSEFVKVRKNLVKNMSKYSSNTMKDFEANADILNMLELKYQEFDISGILTNVIAQLDKTGNEEFSTAAFESLRDLMLKAKGAVEMEDALGFFNEIDFSNPIDALDKINEEIKQGTGLSYELAVSLKEANGSFLGFQSQLTSLTQSEGFEDIKKDLDEIIEKNGEISAMDVYDLVDSYDSLNKMLKNNEITAEGLSQVLEGLADGSLQVEHLTDAVLASLSSFESLQSIAAKTVKFFEDFDLGIDESVVGDTIVGWGDKIIENMEKGAVGNSQNLRILDTLFPGWSEDLEGEALVKKMKDLGKLLQGNGLNLRQMWSDLDAGKDYEGNKVVLSEANQEMGLSVKDTGEKIIFEGWEGKNLTSVDLVSWISDAYNVSTELASAMLTDFKNNSIDLAKELKENDYTAGIEDAYEALRQYGDIKLVDEQEIKTIAKLLNVNEDQVRKTLVEKYGATETQFYDEKGQIKSYEDISSSMNAVVSGAEAGKKWTDAFYQQVEMGSQGTFEQVLNLSDLEKELAKLGISGVNAEKMKQQAFQSIKDGLGEGANAGYAIVKQTLENGQEIQVKVTPETTYEQYQQQITAQIQEAQNAALASAIGESVATAMNNIEVTSSITENSIIEIRTSVEGAVQGANTEVSPTISEESAATLTSQVEGAIPSEKTITVNYRQGSYGLPYISPTKTVTVNYKIGFGLGSTVDEEYAKGVKNASYDHNALVSEEGPELIQTRNGAYLTGQNGPEIVHINKGDTVYTAEETQEIFKNKDHALLPRFAEGYGYGNAYSGTSGGKKGSSKSEEEDKWENPFDKLYNLLRKIDEELRQRERIERRYEKLLESLDVSANKIIAINREELAQLERERMLQEQLIEGREYQIQKYQEENSDLQQYARVMENERGEKVLRIDWDRINAVTDTEKGDRIEAYVSQLEEWFDDLEGAEDALWEIEDAVAEIKERGKEQYEELEDKIKDAVTQTYQEQIDKLSQINESINETNTELLDAIQESIDKSRQERDNRKTEQEIAEKQRRLLYLQQDTSGANALEIMQLQKEIEEGQEDYTDTLIDQKISELQKQNDDAAKQREKQITLMQAQLDHYIESGEIWNEVYKLMEDGLDGDNGLIRGSRLEDILKNADNFTGLSIIGQQSWWKEMTEMIASALAWLETGRQLEDLGIKNQDIEMILSSGEVVKGRVDENGNVTTEDGTVYDNVWQGADGRYYAGENTPKPEEPVVENPGDGSDGYVEPEAPKTVTIKKNIKNTPQGYNVRSGASLNASKVGALPRGTEIEIDGYKADWYHIINPLVGFIHNGAITSSVDKSQLKAYKTGGLADFTGPAWLDGSKSRPEIVLNSQDSRNFIQLRDILSSVLNRGTISTPTENSGDITYDIDINVENIGNDYDVEQVANKVKSLINEDARYRNNNAVSLKR